MKELEDRKKKEKKNNDNQRCDDKHIAGSVKLPQAIMSRNMNKIKKEPKYEQSDEQDWLWGVSGCMSGCK